MSDLADSDSRILQCPKAPDRYYYSVACKTIFRPGGLRPWCNTCPHFADAQDPMQTDGEVKNEVAG